MEQGRGTARLARTAGARATKRSRTRRRTEGSASAPFEPGRKDAAADAAVLTCQRCWEHLSSQEREKAASLTILRVPEAQNLTLIPY